MKKSRFLVPNLFTGLNFLLGVFAILIMLESFVGQGIQGTILGTGKAPVILGAWILIWCVLFDKLDGFAAKVLNAGSEFGAQFDSLAFGLAPALLVYYYTAFASEPWFLKHRPLMVISVGIYVLCAALRLARYNAVDIDELGQYFHGLPSTFAGGAIALCVILYDKYLFVGNSGTGLLLLPLSLIFAGFLMVSPLYLPKLVRRRHKLFNLIQVVNTALGYIFGFGMIFPEYLFTILALYGVIGFTYGFIQKGVIHPPETSEDLEG